VFKTWGWGQGESNVERVGGMERAVLWGQSSEVDVFDGWEFEVWLVGRNRWKKGKSRQNMLKVVKRAFATLVGAEHPVGIVP